MHVPRVAALCAAGVGLLIPAGAPQHSQVSEYPTPLVREEQTVVVNGAAETWQLRWVSAPKPQCAASEVELAMTCPCTGFAYGEAGDLSLIRLRNGSEIDGLHITPLFEEQFQGEGNLAIIQRWAFDDEKDVSSAQEDLSAAVSKRPVVQVMQFADYDHDGSATEFYVQTEAPPCGKSLGVVIGVSKSSLQLHAFGTASHPEKPLYLQKHEWEALRDTAAPVEVLDWPCGDHGADTETTVLLGWTSAGIQGTRREFTCPPKGEKKELIHEEPL